MKRTVLAILAAAALALPVCAQPPAAVGDVPFAFVAGTMTMPAGRYAVSFSSQVIVALVGSDRHTHFLTSNREETRPSSDMPELVFHRYGDQYFLSEIRTSDSGREIPMSRLEREAVKTAGAARAGQEVILAMR